MQAHDRDDHVQAHVQAHDRTPPFFFLVGLVPLTPAKSPKCIRDDRDRLRAVGGVPSQGNDVPPP